MVRAVKKVWGHRKGQSTEWREAAAGPASRLHRTPALNAPQDGARGTPTERGRLRKHPDRT